MILKIATGVLLIVMAFRPSPTLAGDGFVERIERFLMILESNPSYRISHDYDLYGEGEMIIDDKVCGERPGLSAEERNLCADLASRRFQEDNATPSLLLLWLRTKLPKNPTITVLEVEWKQRYSRHVITTKLDETIVIFNFYNEGPSYSPLDVQSINGVNILDILEQDIQDGLSVSVLLEGTEQ